MQNGAAAMQTLMDQIKNSKDPTERNKLLEQHHQMMVKQVQAMEHMSCGMGMPGGMPGAGRGAKGGPMGSMGSGQQGGMMNGDMLQCHQMMEARLKMTATLMEQMMLEEMMDQVKAE